MNVLPYSSFCYEFKKLCKQLRFATGLAREIYMDELHDLIAKYPEHYERMENEQC